LARRQKIFQQLALTRQEMIVLPDVPHFYFDKNIPIRFAIHELFGVTPDPAAVTLVQAVLKGKIRATVSLDCIRALYSHVGHRLARSSEEGGKDLDEKEAEAMARKYAGELFFGRKGLWRFLSFTEHHFDLCTVKRKLPKLSLEDALEVHLFAVAKKKLGAELFVTADGGILVYGEAVHPRQVVKTYADFCT